MSITLRGSCLKTQSSTAQPKTKLPDNLFSLPAPAFVDTYSETVGVSETDLSPQDRDTLISAIRDGASRMRVIDAIDGRSAINVPVTRLDDQNAIRQPASQFALIDVLARFAPEDDVAFLRHVFARICERQPDKRERLEFEFDLRRGVIDRQTLIRRAVEIARREGANALWDTLADQADSGGNINSDKNYARSLPLGLVYDHDGVETITLVREAPGTGWLIGPDVLRQPLEPFDGGWAVREGWLIVGPKRTLKAGKWRIDIDLLQSPEAIVDLDIVANAGLDVLLRAALCGPFCGSFCLDFLPDHHFSELRIAVRQQAAPSWIRPRKISMHRLAQ
jgi:hypothetical protein